MSIKFSSNTLQMSNRFQLAAINLSVLIINEEGRIFSPLPVFLVSKKTFYWSKGKALGERLEIKNKNDVACCQT